MPPKSKRKRVHAQIRTDVPQEDAIVTRVEVTRGLHHQILTKSTKVSIPTAPTVPSQHQSPETQDTLPFTVDDDPAPTPKKARKGPSRSVAVRSSFPLSQHAFITKSTV